MARKTIPIKYYLEAAQVFHWATLEHFILWFLGVLVRHRRTESVLRKLVQHGNLRCVRFGKRLVYTVPRRTKGKVPALLKEKKSYEAGETEKAIAGKNKIVHGLACTEGLVRFWRSDMTGEIFAERFFYGLGAVPEWGIRYMNKKTMLLFEFCTRSNFEFSNNMKGKLNAYRRHRQEIENKFVCEAVVLFVIDVEREKVKRFVGNLKRDVGSDADGDQSALSEGDRFPFDPFFFVDYETFLKVPIGKQLTEKIYFWVDGNVYPLRRS